MTMNQQGTFDVHFEKYNEDISIVRPTLLIQNIIFGGIYVDMEGLSIGVNHKTGERFEVTFFPRKSTTEQSRISGKFFDAHGNLKITLDGSWLNEIRLTTVDTGVTETAWQEPPLIPNAHLQYYFDYDSILMNYVCEDMKDNIAPTDSRFRNDQRYYEEGQMEEAEIEKVAVEERQRRTRRLVDEGKMEAPRPRFFRKVEHPYVRNEVMQTFEDPPIYYELIDDDSGYWQRRNRQDWDDLPDLWGLKEDKYDNIHTYIESSKFVSFTN